MLLLLPGLAFAQSSSSTQPDMPNTASLASASMTFVEAYDALLQRFVERPGKGYSGVDYAALSVAPERQQARALLDEMVLPEDFASGEKALLLDAYNFLVLDAVAEAWPIASVQDEAEFFSAKRHRAFGQRWSLDGLEKGTLYKRYPDPRLHLALVCGAVGCPPLWNRSYAKAAEEAVRDAAGSAASPTGVGRLDEAAYAKALDALLDNAARRAVANVDFLREEEGTLRLSRIFDWYAADFGGSDDAVVAWINRYRDEPLRGERIEYLNYDWSVNARRMPVEDAAGASGAAAKNAGNSRAESADPEASSDPGGSSDPSGSSDPEGFVPPRANAFNPDVPPNAGRYVVSGTVPKGTAELRVFNNLYSQRTRASAEGDFSDRATFFTSQISALYGLTDRFMIGVEGRYRLVRNGPSTETPFSVFAGAGETGSFRHGLTTLGPKIRWAPVKKWSNFSVQSAFWLPIGDSLSNEPFIDWNGATWWTQFFNDFSLGEHWSLFTEIDVLWEDIGSTDDGRINRVSTPVVLIATYLPRWDWSIYGITGYSPFWQETFDWFGQAGIGVKHQFTRNFELELLYTGFTNRGLVENNGRAQTINLGLRVNVGQ